MDDVAHQEYINQKDDLDCEMFRQPEAYGHDARRILNSVGVSEGRKRLRADSTLMAQSIREPVSCQLSGGNPSTSVSREPGRCRLLQGSTTSGQDRRVAGPRHRSGVVSRSSVQLNTCKSPSTDSTTSLIQLRDKLTALSPINYYKVPPKIASTPDLPVLRELDENETSSHSVPNTKRCGVVLKYHSDSESATVNFRKKTRCLSPVVENHSASLVLVSALDNTNETLTNAVFDELYKSNPNLDLADLLIVEALEHGQEKDSGIISGKVTQDSDIVENTPVDDGVCLKKSILKRNDKINLRDNSTIEESELEVIEDTPCYVYDRKQNLRKNRSKANKINSEKDITDVEQFFSQHVNQNHAENVISPSLARKINATSSEDSDDECLISIKDRFLEKEPSAQDLAVEADVADYINSILDSVCNDIDNYEKSLTEQERRIQLRSPKSIHDNSSISRSSNKPKPNQNKSFRHEADDSKKVILKFNQSKKLAPKMNTRKKTAKKDKDSNCIETRNVLVEKTNTSSPISSAKAALIRKKRKLYSPKDDESENNEVLTSRAKIQRRRKNINETSTATCYRELEKARKSQSKVHEKRRDSIQAKNNTKNSRYSMCTEGHGEDSLFQVRGRSSLSSIASTPSRGKIERLVKPVNYSDAHYSTLPSSADDEDFKPNRASKPKSVKKTKTRSCKIGRSSKTLPVLSPKTKKLNEMFDNIKNNVVNNEKINLVEKKRFEKDSLYNLSSESEEFEKRNVSVRKRISSSSLDVPKTKRQRSISRVNYSEYYSSDNENKKNKKTKTAAKQAKPRSRKANKIPTPTHLIDERMRVAQQESLETSFVKETVDEINLEEPEPVLQQFPALEIMRTDKLNDALAEDITPAKLNNSKIKKENKNKRSMRSIARTRSKENIENVSKEKDSASVSPLPGLVVEKERTRKDDLTTSLDTNLLQKLKNIYTDEHTLNETDQTRNLLLNADENDNAVLDPSEILNTALMTDAMSEKSIATGGYSPITAHNDLNEAPPNIELLYEQFCHRDVHNEDMNESMAEFLVNMRNQLQTKERPPSQTSPVIPITRMSTKERARTNEFAKSIPIVSIAEPNKMPTKEIESQSQIISPKSKPSVVLTRMSSEDIEKYLTPRHSKSTSKSASPKIVLERISSDEISKWLPMPTSNEKTAHKEGTISKRIENTPDIGEKKNKTIISPVRLNFDIESLTTNHRNTRLRTRSCKSTKSQATTKKPLQTDDITSSTQKENKNDKNSQDTIKSSATSLKPVKTAPAVDPSDINRSIASVQDWFHRNANQSTSGTADNPVNQEVFHHVMEAIKTTLAEINMGTSERFTAAFLKYQEKISSIEKELHDRLQELKKDIREMACEVLRDDTKNKELMVKLLQEDIVRLLSIEG